MRPAKSFAAAAWAVAVADVSMILDNVLAVASAAREHPGILMIGLLLSVALMGLAANFIARYIERYRWIAYIGLLVILYVAGEMIYKGYVDPELGVARCSASRGAPARRRRSSRIAAQASKNLTDRQFAMSAIGGFWRFVCFLHVSRPSELAGECRTMRRLS